MVRLVERLIHSYDSEYKNPPRVRGIFYGNWICFSAMLNVSDYWK